MSSDSLDARRVRAAGHQSLKFEAIRADENSFFVISGHGVRSRVLAGISPPA